MRKIAARIIRKRSNKLESQIQPFKISITSTKIRPSHQSKQKTNMCIAVFVWQAHPLYPFFLLLNRDEYHSRATKSLAWWGDGDSILGGRDEVAGGTWLACNKDGKVAFITNFREAKSAVPAVKSRGDLPVRFCQSNKSPKQFAEEMLEEADEYSGFNLVVADICSKSMVYITNRPKADQCLVTEVSPGIHVLTNASLDSPWPKALRLGQNFRSLLDNYGEGDLPIKEMVEVLMSNTVKDEDESLLPNIYPVKFEYQLSSIFVDTHTPLGRYGTRSTSGLSVKSNGEVDFYEKYLDKERWKDQTVSYQIQKND